MNAAFGWAVFVFTTIAVAGQAEAGDSPWIRPQKPGDMLVWGRHDGIVFGLPAKPDWGIPRGLIRVGIFPSGAKKPQLLNYIAVEPVVALPNDPNKKGFSELEQSQLDPGKEGKRLWVDEAGSPEAFRGKLTTIHKGGATVERLSVPIGVERFTANGAYVRLVASVDSDNPNEVRFEVFAQKDSPPVKELTLTATMGNWERLRLVWLKDRVLDSRKLFPQYLEGGFAEGEAYPASEMLRTAQGDPIVYASSSEINPADGKTAPWPYDLPKLSQYWRVPAADVQPDLRLRVNARSIYWGSKSFVLGGVAFENFEFRQSYAPGQTFIYGISRQEPWVAYRGPSQVKPYPLEPSATNGDRHP